MDSRPLETRSGPLENVLGRVRINPLSVRAASQCPLRSESGRSAAAPRMVALCQSRPNAPLNNGRRNDLSPLTCQQTPLALEHLDEIVGHCLHSRNVF